MVHERRHKGAEAQRHKVFLSTGYCLLTPVFFIMLGGKMSYKLRRS